MSWKMHSRDFGKTASFSLNIMLITQRDDDFRETKLVEEDIPFIQDELDNVTTIIYLTIEGIRNDPVALESARTKIR